ncbi:MAG: acetate/propionate family kinase [Usitatibacteraceae bacterium]
MANGSAIEAVLVINAGSSSIKFALYNPDAFPGSLRSIASGHVAQTGADLEVLVKMNGTTDVARTPMAAPQFDPNEAMARMFAWLDKHRAGIDIIAVGHRVVHGGSRYLAAARITHEVVRELTAIIPLAPLHQPHSLKAIAATRTRWPGVPEVACFDTAFHSTQAPVTQAFALPREITDAGVRRYGFHGLSYEYIASQLPRVLGDTSRGKVIAAHLGNGASLCAMVDGKSVASTMGFSALGGLMMGTRSGTLDPGAILYLLQGLRMTADEVSDLLYRRSGLLGVSGISSDMQVLLRSTDPHAREAIELYVYRIITEIGALAAVMGGVDALVFSAGIGEHSPAIRAGVVEGCAWLGAVIDSAANDQSKERVEAATSKLRIAVVPTDEEQMIALHTLSTIGWASSH